MGEPYHLTPPQIDRMTLRQLLLFAERQRHEPSPEEIQRHVDSYRAEQGL